MAIVQMIRRYTDVEKQFQIGHYDKVVTTMRALNKDNVQKVVDTVFAHTQGNLLKGIVIWFVRREGIMIIIIIRHQKYSFCILKFTKLLVES